MLMMSITALSANKLDHMAAKIESIRIALIPISRMQPCNKEYMMCGYKPVPTVRWVPHSNL